MNNKPRKGQKRTPKTPLSRIGVGAGAVTLAGATGYMNISAWVAQATSRPEQIVNGCISGSLEAVGAAGLAWAGWQFSKKRPLRAFLAAAAAGGAIYFNTGASQNYYAGQDVAAENVIERSVQTVESLEAELERLQAETDAIIAQNDGVIPRPIPVIEAAYSHLDPETNPINMARKATEIGLREEYDRLQHEIAETRILLTDHVPTATDVVDPVIPRSQRLTFIWAVEVFKGSAFFLLGTNKMGSAPKRTTAQTPSSPIPPAPERPTPSQPSRMSLDERDRRRRFAIMRAKGVLTPRE